MSKIALACDHGGFKLMASVRDFLDSKGFAYVDFGTSTPKACDYPVIMAPAAKAIVLGQCDNGIFICGTGIGISMAANKVRGIRAALCTSGFMAEMARAHNNANVLVLGGRVVGSELALAIVDKFLSTDFSGDERHLRRVELLMGLEDVK